MRILVTNDDGVNSYGLKILAKFAQNLGEDKNAKYFIYEEIKGRPRYIVSERTYNSENNQ